LAILGGIVAAIALFLKSATSDAGDVLAQLAQANPAFPDGFDNIWTGIYDDKSWAAILLAIALVAGIALAFAPPVRDAMAGTMGISLLVAGVIASIVAVVAMLDALDRASALNDGFDAAFAGGLTPQAFLASIGFGWYLLVGGAVVMALAGLLGVLGGRRS
jgi:hypothetical protein